MKIELVTFTGADESVTPEDIVHLVYEFPDVKIEWALLLSKTNEGKQTRYPGLDWMNALVETMFPTVTDNDGHDCFHQQAGCRLAGHIQGQWLRTFVEKGENALRSDRPTLYPFLSRIQLNFHGIRSVVQHDGFFTELRQGNKEYIIQMDGVNEFLYHDANTLHLKPLFDLSAGQGIIPDSWPKPIHPLLNGYAGGLGPETVKEQLKRIEDVVGDGIIWIDMETRIRSEDDRQFDLNKCRRVLDIVAESNYV